MYFTNPKLAHHPAFLAEFVLEAVKSPPETPQDSLALQLGSKF
jgi:hypothetical protein